MHFITPSRIENARGNVTLPLESPTFVGDLNRQRCKKIIHDAFANSEERSSKESGLMSPASRQLTPESTEGACKSMGGLSQQDDTSSNPSFDDQFDDESVFYTLEHYNPDALRASGSMFKGNVTDKSIESEGHRRCPSGFKCLSVYTKPNNNIQKISDDNVITPTITPDTYTTSNRATPDYTYDNQKHNPLIMPDGQIDPYVFWLRDEKRYLFTEGRLILTENRPTYAIPTDFCHTDSSQKKHRIMIYYDINKSFEKRFGYYDSSNCFYGVEYIPEFAYIH